VYLSAIGPNGATGQGAQPATDAIMAGKKFFHIEKLRDQST